jgi:hypothetical protein
VRPGTLQIINLPQPLHDDITALYTRHPTTTMSLPQSKPAWLILAIASGGCAAFNGVFAKLYCSIPSICIALLTNLSTTTELTTSWSSAIASAFGLSPSNKLFEYAIRGVRVPCLPTYLPTYYARLVVNTINSSSLFATSSSTR